MTIEDLPAELLREIMSHLRSPIPMNDSQYRFDWRSNHGDENTGALQAIKSARLTCRRFNEAASQFLLPCVSVSVDQRSLAWIETILENPLITSGVNCVSVDLSFYPREVVTSLEVFRERQMYDIEDDCSYLTHGERFGYRPHCHTLHAEGEGDCSDIEGDIIAKTEGHISAISASWGHGPDREATSASVNYLGALHDAYNTFKASYKEQTELLNSGRFAKTLASLISRLPAFRELRLYDKPKSPRSKHDPLETFSEHYPFKRFLTTPYNFLAAQDNLAPETMEIPTARILRELPIAIHEAGATIRNLRIARFPIHPTDVSRFDITGCEEQFRAALNSLERFELFAHCRRSQTRDDPVPWLESVDAITDKYLAAVISSPSLKELELAFEPYYAKAERYPVSAPISALTSESIMSVLLQHVSLPQNAFDHLCSQASHAMERMCLFQVNMPEGSWTPGVTVLREKTAARCKEGTCLVEAEYLRGGMYNGNGRDVSMRNWQRKIAGRYTGPPFVQPRAPVATALSRAVNALISKHSDPPVA